jgi:hypothetical protein
MTVGDFIVYAIGRVLEMADMPYTMPIFLLLYFANLWLAWIIAVRLTEPKSAAGQAR